MAARLLPQLETDQKLKLLRPLKRAAQTVSLRSAGAERSIVVVGVQRSGTNMIMQALDHRWDTDVYHESDPRAFDEFQMKSSAVMAELRLHSPAKIFITKALLDLHRVEELRETLKPARFIWIYRHFDPMVASHRIKWDHGEYIDQIVEDPASAGFRGLGMSDDTLRTLREIFRPEMSREGRTALFWWFRNKLLFEQGLDSAPDSVLVNYEKIVSAPEESWQLIWDRMDLAPDAKSIRFIHANSKTRKPLPEIEDDVRALCDEMWDRLNAAADIPAP